MLVTLVSMVMVTAWALVISLIWAMVRKFHRSKPPGRQTVRIHVPICTESILLEGCHRPDLLLHVLL